MKKLLTLSILTYLLFTINSSATNQSTDENLKKNNEILKIGVLVPLSGEFKQIGQSVLKAIQMAVYELDESNIEIYPKDSKNNAVDTYLAAKEFENFGIEIVIGPIFYDNLEKLSNTNNITFISLTNKTQNLPKNIIAFGINVESQIAAITKYLKDEKITKTILLLPESNFTSQIKPIIKNNDFNFFRTFSYNTNPKKITAEVERITDYRQRKINLKARIKKLEKSDLEKHKRELEELKERYTLGKVDFESVVIADFGESLKSVLTSFTYADVSNEEVQFFAFNQWFDESLFNEASFQNLIFPGIDLINFNKFNKRYFEKFNEPAIEISILAYDAMGLIYLIWNNNKSNFKIDKVSTKSGFKGLHGEFTIKNNLSYQNLKIYKIIEKKFVKIN